MRIVLKSSFENGRRMERVIRSKEDIDRAVVAFEQNHLDALAHELSKLKSNLCPEEDCCCAISARIEHGKFRTVGRWWIFEDIDISRAAGDLRGQLYRLLVLEQPSTNQLAITKYPELLRGLADQLEKLAA